MPPKRKIAKIEEDTSAQKPAKSAADNKKPEKNVETSSRTLRPRKVPTVAEPHTEPPKTKANAKKPKKLENGASVNNKKSPTKTNKGRKAKNVEEPEVTNEESEIEPDDELANATSIYNFTAKDINGEEVSLDKYKGHVCIIVNVASKCGHTSAHYKEFVEIYDKFSEDKGLRVLAFPCNQFGKQEPGDNEKICEFAKKRNVKFDMFEKIEVNGKNAHPLWKYLTSQKDGPKGTKIDWNFTKFLINKEGEVVERFKPGIKPSALVKELEKLW